MSFRWLIGMGITAVLSVLLVLGAVQFTGSETQAQEPPTECMIECLLIADFNGDTVFDVDDVLAFVDGYESQDPAFDHDGDGDVDVFDVLGYASDIRACVLDCVTPAP